jgi:hypothetical protein
MGSDAALHADQARRQVGQPSSDLAALPSLAHDDCTTPIQADDVKRILADIDAHGGNWREASCADFGVGVWRFNPKLE